MSTQLELFTPATQPLAFVTICPTCSQPLSTFPLEDAGQPWNEAALWSYIAQATHDRETHAGEARRHCA